MRIIDKFFALFGQELRPIGDPLRPETDAPCKAEHTGTLIAWATPEEAFPAPTEPSKYPWDRRTPTGGLVNHAVSGTPIPVMLPPREHVVSKLDPAAVARPVVLSHKPAPEEPVTEVTATMRTRRHTPLAERENTGRQIMRALYVFREGLTTRSIATLIDKSVKETGNRIRTLEVAGALVRSEGRRTGEGFTWFLTPAAREAITNAKTSVLAD